MKLRHLEEKDAELMLEWMHDQNVTENLRKDFSSFTIENCLSFIRTADQSDTAVHRAIVSDADEYLGTVTIRDIDRSLGTGEFAITVRRKAMGTGASIYGMREILFFAVNSLDLKKVFWCVSEANSRAVRFYRKNGFKEVKESMVPDYLKNQYSGESAPLLWFCFEKKPLISMIVTTYNNADEIDDSLDTILNQDYPCIELIISDDGSRDFETAKKHIEEYVEANKHGNLVSFIMNVLEVNQGTVKNINSAIRRSEGEYIMVFGAGDMLSENRTLSLYQDFSRRQTQYVCFGKMRGVTPEGDYKYELLSCDTDYDKLKKFDSKQTLNHLFKRNFLPAPAAFYKASVFEKYGLHDESVRLIEDYPYWMMMCQAGETFAYLDAYTVDYKLSGVTSSGEYGAAFMKDLCLIYDKYIYPYDQRFGKVQKLYNGLKQGGLNFYCTRADWKNMKTSDKAMAYVKYAPFFVYTGLQQKMNDLKNRKASGNA